TQAGLPGSFLALLATDTALASVRFDASGPPWQRLDGVSLGQPADVLAGHLDAPLNVAADGRSYLLTDVWTGLGTPTCSSWTSSNPQDTGVTGRASTSDHGAFAYYAGTCNNPSHLYCLSP